jgi:hypothetical protein
MICLLAAFALCAADLKTKPPVSKTQAPPVAAARVFLPPVLTRAEFPCLAGEGRIEVHGKLFGAAQGDRLLRVNGVPLPTVLDWRGDFIRCAHDYGFPGGVDVLVDLFDASQNKRVSNALTVLSPICIFGRDPQGALKPKSQVLLLVKQNVGVSANGRRVTLGGNEVPAEWMIHKIRAYVPILPSGGYAIRVEKNGQLISNEVAVTIDAD